MPPPRHRTQTKKSEADQAEGGGFGDLCDLLPWVLEAFKSALPRKRPSTTSPKHDRRSISHAGRFILGTKKHVRSWLQWFRDGQSLPRRGERPGLNGKGRALTKATSILLADV